MLLSLFGVALFGGSPLPPHDVAPARTSLAHASASLRADSTRPSFDAERPDSLAAPLAAVIVTGSVAPTAKREVSHAITVLTAHDLRERGIVRLDQLFRGEVPGVFSRAQTPYDQYGETTTYARGSTSLTGTGGLKVYVDGVEASNPSYYNAIDPASIARIEIIPGPQAATVYGSGALSGVMNIFLKRGTRGTPAQLRGSFMAGATRYAFSSALSPRHDHTLDVAGGDPTISYAAGVSLSSVGEWAPNVSSRTVGAHGGVQKQGSWLTADATARFGLRRMTGTGQGATGGVVANERILGNFVYEASNLVPFTRPSVLRTQTVSTSLLATPTRWWTQRLTVGRDESVTQGLPTAPTYITPQDSLMTLNEGTTARVTGAYNTTFILPFSTIHPTITLGADTRRTTLSSWLVLTGVREGSLGASQSLTRRDDPAKGYYGQAQIGVFDALYLTAGVRAEDNPFYGERYGLSYTPRVGAAYTFVAGPVTTKLRAASGRATQPPAPTAKTGSLTPTVSSVYGTYFTVLPAPVLGPEQQRGTEYGAEWYVGSALSAQVTRYEQTVDGLIVNVKDDSVQSLLPNGSGVYTYASQFRFQNLGRIRNAGWETEASARLGAITARGTYSWTRSRILSIDPRYTGTQKAGDSFTGFAEHTGAVSVRYASGAWTAGVLTDIIGQTIVANSERFYVCGQTRLKVSLDRQCSGSTRQTAPAYATVDIDATWRLTPIVTAVVRTSNLSNVSRDDSNFSFPTMGRSVVAGIRIH